MYVQQFFQGVSNVRHIVAKSFSEGAGAGIDSVGVIAAAGAFVEGWKGRQNDLGSLAGGIEQWEIVPHHRCEQFFVGKANRAAHMQHAISYSRCLAVMCVVAMFGEERVDHNCFRSAFE